MESILSRIKMVFTEDEISRISFENSRDSDISITVDAHGMSCASLQKYLNNLICTVHKGFRLIVIHGYNHGTALKDMLAEMYHNRHVIDRYVLPDNPGRTCMIVV